VRRPYTCVTLAASIFCCFVPLAKANVVVNPRMKLADPCGVVVGPDGEAIPKVKVTLELGSQRVETETDEKGRFRFEVSGGTNAVVVASASGFASASGKVEVIRSTNIKCRKPIYVELTVGENFSMMSTKKSDLPIAKRD
jgi:Carboxypeptidase regulatory-like domain